MEIDVLAPQVDKCFSRPDVGMWEEGESAAVCYAAIGLHDVLRLNPARAGEHLYIQYRHRSHTGTFKLLLGIFF